jgi:hypothetical protein
MTTYYCSTIEEALRRDRLYLGRVGIIPNQERMATDKGKEIAK